MPGICTREGSLSRQRIAPSQTPALEERPPRRETAPTAKLLRAYLRVRNKAGRDIEYARRTSPIVHHLPINQARINLGALVKRIHLNKEYVILEKDGIPVAGVMNIDEFEDYLDLELQDPKVRAHIRASNAEYLAGKSRKPGCRGGSLSESEVGLLHAFVA